MKDTIDAVVIGGIHHNTLGVVRSLGDNGLSKINIFLILVNKSEKKKNFVANSKYVKKKNVFVVFESKGVLDSLSEISKDGKKKVIICCSDETAEVVIKNREALKENYYCPSAELDIASLMTKSFQFEVANSVGMSIPQTLKISKGQDFQWEIFPCISKPDKSSIGGGKTDIHISNNKNELDFFIAKTISEQLFVQEYIDKDFEYQLIGCSLDNGKHIIIPGFTRIIRQPYNTNTGYLEYMPISKLDYNSKAVEDFIKKIGYNGLFSIEFIRDKNQNDHFLEINMRNDGNAFCVKSAGINLPYIWCYYQKFGIIPNCKTSFEKTIRFMPEFPDSRQGIKEVGIFKWLFQFLGARSHAVMNWKDMGPFWSYVFNRFRSKR